MNKPKRRIFLPGLLAALALLILIGVFFIHPSAASEEADLGDSIPVSACPESGSYTHILLIGADRESGGASRADVIMLCSVDKANNKLLITSFLRDMYIPIPGHDNNRINAAYAFGGAQLLKQCLQESFGISADHTVELDFEGFSAIIDALGGVEVSLSSEEAAYLGLPEGRHLLSGTQALRYVRMRDAQNGDFGRTRRQQTLLAEMGHKISSAGFASGYKCLQSAMKYVKTDLTVPAILGLLPDILFASVGGKCSALQIPAEGAYQNATVNRMQVLVPDLAANRAILQEYFS
jgi:LCP family protein required for cell wall assembly